VIKSAQRAAGLVEDGVVGERMKTALRVAHGLHEDAAEKPALPPKDGATIKWTLAIGALPHCLRRHKEAVTAEIAQAFSVWGAAMPGVTFVMAAEDEPGEKVVLKFADHTPRNKHAFDGPGGQLAVAGVSSIAFDSSERWELCAGGSPHPQRVHLSDEFFFKLLPVTIHEIGHLLGLGHSAAPSDVMSPYYAAEKVTLSANDKERIAKLVAAAA